MANVFVLCTGRCGSVTFSRAAGHITNYSAGHETRSNLLGTARTAYPVRHIEADNRLSWILGRLQRAYGDEARYVHLVRDPEDVARSFAKRWGIGIISAYHKGILMGAQEDRLAVCRDYVDTVNSNISAFLTDKPQKMLFRMEQAAEDWPAFWDWVGAEGDYQAALSEWKVSHNSGEPTRLPRRIQSLLRKSRSHA